LQKKLQDSTNFYTNAHPEIISIIIFGN